MNLSRGGRETEFSNAPATLAVALLRKSHQENGDRGNALRLKNGGLSFPFPVEKSQFYYSTESRNDK